METVTDRNEDIRAWIREGLSDPRKSRSGLARAIAKHPSTVTKILAGERLVKATEIPLIANYLGTPPPLSDERPDEPNVRRLSDPPDLPADSRYWPQDVPLFSSAQGGGFEAGDDGPLIEYDFEYGNGPTEFVRRPPAVAQLRDLFAVRVRGDSMSPWREHGDVVFVAPHRPYQPGDHVIVELQSTEYTPRRGLLKRLMAINSHRVILAQYSPPIDDIEVPRREIRAIYKVLEWREVFPLG